MALSDRIALLREGRLEQIASPREIYARPATSYTAQFIGQTNLLRAVAASGVAKCPDFSFPCTCPDGPAVFSVRPEVIAVASKVSEVSNPVRFSAAIRQRIYSGATELLELQTQSGSLLRARIASGDPLFGTHEFVFSAADAIPVQE